MGQRSAHGIRCHGQLRSLDVVWKGLARCQDRNVQNGSLHPDLLVRALPIGVMLAGDFGRLRRKEQLEVFQKQPMQNS